MVSDRPQKTGRQPLDAEVYSIGQRTATLERPAAPLVVTLVNGWAAVGEAQVRVHQVIVGGSRMALMSGVLNPAAASGTTFGYLPPGFRPLNNARFPAASLNGGTVTARLLRVDADGTLSFNSLDAGATYYADGFAWLAER